MPARRRKSRRSSSARSGEGAAASPLLIHAGGPQAPRAPPRGAAASEEEDDDDDAAPPRASEDDDDDDRRSARVPSCACSWSRLKTAAATRTADRRRRRRRPATSTARGSLELKRELSGVYAWASGLAVVAFAACCAVFSATVEHDGGAPEGDELFRWVSACAATCFATTLVCNGLSLAIDHLEGATATDGAEHDAAAAAATVWSSSGGRRPPLSWRGPAEADACGSPKLCIVVIHVISTISHAAMAFDALPVARSFCGRRFHTARWAEWLALVPLNMVLLHGCGSFFEQPPPAADLNSSHEDINSGPASGTATCTDVDDLRGPPPPGDDASDPAPGGVGWPRTTPRIAELLSHWYDLTVHMTTAAASPTASATPPESSSSSSSLNTKEDATDPSAVAAAPEGFGLATATVSIAAQTLSTALGAVCTVYKLPAPVTAVCLVVSMVLYLNIFSVLGIALAYARSVLARLDAGLLPETGDAPEEHPGASPSWCPPAAGGATISDAADTSSSSSSSRRDAESHTRLRARRFEELVAVYEHRERATRTALMVAVCAVLWTVFVVIYFLGVLGLVSDLVEGLLLTATDVLTKAFYVAALGEAHTRKVARERALHRLLDMEHAAAAQRRRFLRFVLHEVRVPLNAVKLGVSEVVDAATRLRGPAPPRASLDDRPSSVTNDTDDCDPGHDDDDVERDDKSSAAAEIGEVLAVVDKSLAVMSETLDDVLSYAAIEEGRFELRCAAFSVVDLVGLAVATHAPTAHERRVALATRVDAAAAAVLVYGDARRLGACVSNFVSNALKFSKTADDAEGVDRPTVEVCASIVGPAAPTARPRLPPVDADRAVVVTLRVAVRDNGVGIAAADQARLFQVFSQIDPHELQQGKGSGLGLAIAREIVEQHGGVIACASTVGRGSTFSFDVPLAVVGRRGGRGPARDEPADKAPGGEGRTSTCCHQRSRRRDDGGGGSTTRALPTGVERASLSSASDDDDGSRPETARDRNTADDEPPSPGTPGIGVGVAASPTTRGDQERPLRALVVDDAPSNRALLALHLARKLGFDDVAQAADGLEALAACGVDCGETTATTHKRHPDFDVIFMDAVMPNLGGVEATRRLRAAGVACRVVGVTGNAFAEDVQVFLTAGADAVITKPVDRAELRRTLADLGVLAAQNGAAGEQAAAAVSSAGAGVATRSASF